jgi:hypothetical protein
LFDSVHSEHSYLRKSRQPAEHSSQTNRPSATSNIHFSLHDAKGTAMIEIRIEVAVEENHREQIFVTIPTYTWSDLTKPK